ncbi:E3 ubiquitin-protein ligase DCST1 [Scomber scombrus]|uniref:E3 ubiquitin-protein ligase DCST1 n=1 Tax=Scomber scombrus TaxID=13677 RepID=UPI002DD8A519|nr:E3 ubiquitin-protein ligase DCST1 [Scomber scombrus]
MMPAVHRFLFSQSGESVAGQVILRVLIGAVGGAVLFLGVALSLPLTFDLQLAAGCTCVGVCAVGGAVSSSFRCSVLLMFPSMLGSRGRAYLMLLVLSVLQAGPVANIQRNVEAAATSLSCNLDLQVQHSRLLWRQAVSPFLLISQQLTEQQAELQAEARSVDRKFQTIRDEVMLQYGYDRFSPKQAGVAAGNSTQQQFTAKTMMQCDSVVEQGVKRCADWFGLKWAECMKAIPVPVINHILCVSMKFHFLCDVMRVMTPWCRQQLPVEGNFGQLFDRLNSSVDLLSREFSSEVEVEEQQQQQMVLDQNFTETISGSFSRLSASTQQLLDVLQLLRCFTFVTVFTQALGYLLRYRKDLGFDNVYVTASFRRLDARRRRAGRRCLLPLSPADRRRLVDPCSPAVLPDELRQVSSGVLQVLSVSLLSAALLAIDISLFRVLDAVGRHGFTRLRLAAAQRVEVSVGGASMMARLLRKTVAAFNSSSSLRVDSDTRVCARLPSLLPASVYVSCACCVLLAALLSLLQVYTNRLRRLIAARFHPDTEHRRVLFLYTLQMHRRRTAHRKRIIGQRCGHLCCGRRQEVSH